VPRLIEAATWISGLRLEDIPPRVQTKVRHQTLNMLAAAMAGIGSGVGRRLVEAFPVSGGKAWSLPRGRAYSLDEAIILGASLTMTLDYDDYLVFGHTGHSAVIASLVLGDLENKSLSEVIPAMVVANEIAGRLGAATVLGPRNGQMWSYIHLAGGAAAASHILGLDEERTAHALALAFYQPVLPLYPGFMAGESKVLTAASPTLLGVHAALLARAGVQGNPGILEGEGGFLDELSFVPAPFFLSGWGRAWVSDSLAYKPYPGCAYLDTTLDAWEEIRNQVQSQGGGPLSHEDIEEILVEASLLTMGMDDLSRAYGGSNPLAPVNINFSIATSLALAILDSRLTPGALEPSYLEAHRDIILGLASRIKLVHDWRATYELLETLDRTMNIAAVFSNFRPAQLLALRSELKKSLGNTAFGLRDIREALSALPISWKKSLIRIPWHMLLAAFKRSRLHDFDLGEVDMEELRLPFPSHLTLRLRGGKSYSARCSIPRGAPGNASYLEEVPLKWGREAASCLGEERSGDIARLVLDEDPPLAELLGLVTPQ
jgi:2-methylcitrate dehydratase PrpD